MKNKSFIRGALCGALTVLLITGLVSCGLMRSDLMSKETEEKLHVLKAYIDAKYLNPVEEKDLQEGILKGYVAALEDPYSEYLDAEETSDLMETTTGEYVGVGAVLQQDAENGIITATTIYEDSPAEKAGMRDNDILYKVEGEEVTGQDLDDVVSRVRGEEGTEVHLTVLRGEKKEEVEMTAVRGKVEYRTVEHEMLKDSVGYIHIVEFGKVTYEQYIEALDELEGQGMKGLVVDLRSNPGGNYYTVCDILDAMLPEGTIVYTKDRDGKEEKMTSNEEDQFNLPMAVLVNGYSASASEIYAGAIQDYGLGKIVGTQSYGKGVVQEIYDLKDGTALKLTVSEYYTPKGRNIHGKGITPDVVVEYEPDEKNPDADNQKDAAVAEVLKEIAK